MPQQTNQILCLDPNPAGQYIFLVRFWFNRASIIAGVISASVSIAASTEPMSTPDGAARSKASHQKDILFGGYTRANADSYSLMMWARVQGFLAPGAVSGAALKAYATTNKSEAEIEEILSKKLGFQEHVAKPRAQKITKFMRQTPVKGIFLVIVTFEGVISAYNLVVEPPPNEIPYSKALEQRKQSGALPLISAQEEDAYVARLSRRASVIRNLKYIIAGATAAGVLIIFLVLRKRGDL